MTNKNDKYGHTLTEPQYGISPELVAHTEQALVTHDRKAILAILRKYHVADVADLIEILAPEERDHFIDLAKGHLNPEILAELDDSVRERIVDGLNLEEIADAIKNLDSDDAVSVVEDLDSFQQQALFEFLPKAERDHLERSLSFPEDSAGRLMQQEVPRVPETVRISHVKTYLATQAKNMPDTFYELYVVDKAGVLVGSIPLHRVLCATGGTLLADVIDRYMHKIPVTLDQEHVAYLFRQYGLVSAPVVDEGGHLLGMITVDDVVHVLNEEMEEDFMRFSGVEPTDFWDSTFQTAILRLRWLFIGFVNTLITSLVIYQFKPALKAMVALAIIMPVISAMGGNAGMQVVTVTVRALAMRQLGWRKHAIWEAIIKEISIGVITGFIFGLLLCVGAGWWFVDFTLGAIIGLAMFLNSLWAGLAGTFLPLLLSRFKIDPAIAGGPILTTSTDIVGFALLLGLATWLLM